MKHQRLLAAAVAAALLQTSLTTQAGLFKIDFGSLENERAPVDASDIPLTDANGIPIGPPPVLLDWNVIPTWTFADPNANVTPDSASVLGVASADGNSVTWMYDGVRVPGIVKDDYMYRNPDTDGSETLMRIANLDP